MEPLKGNEFIQLSENTPAEFVLIHIPDKDVFISNFHPSSALYEDVTEIKSIKHCMKQLTAILNKHNVHVFTVRDCLKLNKQKLKELAFTNLTYINTENENNNYDKEKYKKFLYYCSDEYKKSIIEKLLPDQLVDIIITKPTYHLKYVDHNTFIEASQINFNPVGGLVFCRDQQITTQKGVIIGRAYSNQRGAENDIMEIVFKNLGAKIIGRIPEGTFLEGGDFFAAKYDLSLLGIGLRTKVEAAYYLMNNNLIGSRRFALVVDEFDLDQQRMHLDTYFNILNDEYCLVLDFEDCSKVCGKNINRKVYLYDRKNDEEGIKSDSDNIKSQCGFYKLSKIFDNFYDYLNYEGYKMIKVTHKQQEEYMINFLNIGNNTVLSVNPYFKELVKETGVNVEYIEFKAIMNMYGAMHCATQVGRRNSI